MQMISVFLRLAAANMEQSTSIFINLLYNGGMKIDRNSGQPDRIIFVFHGDLVTDLVTGGRRHIRV